MKPKVSVIIPVYKVEEFIEKSALSLFSQDYDLIEFIFVNDATPDGSIKKLKKLINTFPKIIEKTKIINHLENKGSAAARNTGLENASGEYISFVDSDDWLEPGAITKLMEVASKEDPDILKFGTKFVKPDNGFRIIRKPISVNKSDYLKAVLKRQSLPTVWGSLFKKNLFTENNIFFYEGLNYGEDYTLMPRLILKTKKIVDRPDLVIYNYLDRNSGYTGRLITSKHCDELISGIEQLNKFFSSIEDQDLKHELHKILFLYNLVYLLEYAHFNNWEKIINQYYEAFDYPYKIGIKHQITLILAKNRHFGLLRFYQKIGRKLKGLS